MKKFMSLAVALVAAVVVSSSAFAATEVKSFTARAAFAGVAEFSFTLFKGATEADSLNWTSADAFNMGDVTAWVAADEHAKVVANVTKANYVVHMYTDNKTAFPSLTANQDGSFGGLVRVDSEGALASDFNADYRGYIPVIFSYAKAENVPTLVVNETTGAVTETVTAAQSDRYLTDKSNTGFNDNYNYTTIASLNGPTFFTKAKNDQNVEVDVQYTSNELTDHTAYMYFFGGFKNIIGGDAYTTTIKVVQDVE